MAEQDFGPEILDAQVFVPRLEFETRKYNDLGLLQPPKENHNFPKGWDNYRAELHPHADSAGKYEVVITAKRRSFLRPTRQVGVTLHRPLYSATTPFVERGGRFFAPETPGDILSQYRDFGNNITDTGRRNLVQALAIEALWLELARQGRLEDINPLMQAITPQHFSVNLSQTPTERMRAIRNFALGEQTLFGLFRPHGWRAESNKPFKAKWHDYVVILDVASAMTAAIDRSEDEGSLGNFPWEQVNAVCHRLFRTLGMVTPHDIKKVILQPVLERLDKYRSRFKLPEGSRQFAEIYFPGKD